MEEEWKEIDGYSGRYRVSNMGRVMNSSGLIMAQKPSKDGYVRILLFNPLKGKYKAEYVHILVAKNFVEKTNAPGLEVNHIDGVKSNNAAQNLEWVSKSRNTRHAIELNLRLANPNVGKHGAECKNSKPVAQYDLDGNLVKIWESREDAANFYKTPRGNICRCINGKRKTHRGFIWKNP